MKQEGEDVCKGKRTRRASTGQTIVQPQMETDETPMGKEPLLINESRPVQPALRLARHAGATEELGCAHAAFSFQLHFLHG